MDLNDVVSLIVIGVVVTMAACCLTAVWYIRRVDGLRTEESRYLDMLIVRDTRCGIAMADLLALSAYVLARYAFPETLPTIGAGGVSVWLMTVILLLGWGPIADALQFRRDRHLGGSPGLNGPPFNTDAD